MNNCEIIEYEDKYHDAFRDMNIEWLDLYHLKEDRDLEVLNEPRKNILEQGGFIYLAKIDDRVIGSAALMKEHGDVYELAKMAVAQDYRKMGVSKLLLEACLEKARDLKAKKVILFSNHQLKAALGLYEKYGFQYIEVENSPFLTADIKMELTL